jgi:thiamine-phosphate pyrophosphorylase
LIPCRLFLVAPPLGDASDADRVAARLREACAAGDVACLLARRQGISTENWPQLVAVLRQTARDLGIALLLEERAADAKSHDADGVHLSSGDGYAEARRLLGPEVSIGVTCHGRDQAMAVADDGADYVALGAFDDDAADPSAIGLIGWWAELMNVPCVGAGGATPESCSAVIHAGADFLAPSPSLWTGPDGADGIRHITWIIADFQKSRR